MKHLRQWRIHRLISIFIVLMLSMVLVTEIRSGATQAEIIYAKQLFTSTHCGSAGNDSASVMQISGQKDLSEIYQQLQSHSFGGKGLIIPQHDFTLANLLFISMGQKNSGGYAVKLANEQVKIEGSTVLLHLDWMQPSKGAMVTMALTNPCAIVSVSRGQYERIKLVDQNHHDRGTLMLVK